MALTTSKKVWARLAIIVAVLTVLMGFALYFIDLSILFVVAFALIVIVNTSIKPYIYLMKKLRLPNITKIFIYAFIMTLWFIIIVAIINFTIQDVESVLDYVRASEQPVLDIYVIKIKGFIGPTFSDYLFKQETIDAIGDYSIKLLSDVTSSIFSFILKGVLIIPIVFYLYYRKRKEIVSGFMELVPEHYKRSVHRIGVMLSKELFDFYVAKLWESTAIAIVCATGFYLAGLKGWILFALLAGLLNVIPYIGPVMGAIPPLVFSMLDSSQGIMIYVLLTVLIAQAIDNFYLQPFMISKRVHVNALITIVLTLAGAKLFGVAGMIFAIPIYLMYRTILKESYHNLEEMYKS